MLKIYKQTNCLTFMPKGRPLKTEIREKIACILKYKKSSYGYEIHKIYKKIFGKISLRNLYYNLNKGLELGEFIIVNVKKEEGEFTWGNKVERKYYSIGPQALFYNLTETQVKKLSELKETEFKINWDEKIKSQIKNLKNKIKDFNAKKEKLRYEDKWKLERKLKQNIENLKIWIKEKSDFNKYKEELKKLNNLL